MEELEYWEENMEFLRDGQENIKHESISISINLIKELIASTKEKLAAPWEIKTSVVEKNASFKKEEEELRREMSQSNANFAALHLLSKQLYRLEQNSPKT